MHIAIRYLYIKLATAAFYSQHFGLSKAKIYLITSKHVPIIPLVVRFVRGPFSAS